MDWIYDLPNWLFFLLCIGATVGFAIGGLLLTRPWVKRHADTYSDQNDLVSYFLGASGVIYGIALGLVAAGTWTNFSTLSAQVDEEAAVTSALYQDMSSYPLPERQVFQRDLRSYVQAIIQQDWPLHRKGIVPQASTLRIRSFKRHFFAYSAPDARLKLIHEQAIAQLNDLLKARRLRLQGNEAKLPPVLWGVIILGAAINLVITWFFVSNHLAYQLLLTLLIALLLGSLLFLTAAMDNPFRGDFSVTPETFQSIMSQMPVN
jgi:Protein of unknown function (DUF4239)